MEKIFENEESILIIEGPNPNQEGGTATFGVAESKLAELRKRGLTIKLIHLYHIVGPGLILAKHIFRGLNRPLVYEDDEDGDKSKLVLTWAASHDWDYDHGKRFSPDGLIRRPAPPGTVYAVIATPNPRRDKFLSIDFWVDRWSWVDASNTLAGAPINWEERYSERIY